MPVSGAKPKPQGEKVNRSKPVHDWVEVEDTPNPTKRNLPKRRTNGELWPPRCRERWMIWRAMPHTKLWTESDWDYAIDVMEVAARWYLGGGITTASELRMREGLLGTTADARRDLRIRYVEPKQTHLAIVADADDYRDL